MTDDQLSFESHVSSPPAHIFFRKFCDFNVNLAFMKMFYTCFIESVPTFSFICSFLSLSHCIYCFALNIHLLASQEFAPLGIKKDLFNLTLVYSCYLGWDFSYKIFLVGVRYLNGLPIKFNLPQNCALKRNPKHNNSEWTTLKRKSKEKY